MPDEKKHEDFSEGHTLVRALLLTLYESQNLMSHQLCLSNDYLLDQYHLEALWYMLYSKTNI